jgi:hypothetical protein
MTARLATLRLAWHCLEPGCPATGTTEASAVRHTKDARHGTSTVATPVKP